MNQDDEYYSQGPGIVCEHQTVQVLPNVQRYLWSLVTETLSLDNDDEILGFGQLGSKVLLPPPAARRLSTDSAGCITLDSDSEEETRQVIKRQRMSDGSPLTVSSTAISQGLTRDNNRSPVIITIDDEPCGSIYKRLKYTRFTFCSSSVSSGRSWVGEGWLLVSFSSHSSLRVL